MLPLCRHFYRILKSATNVKTTALSVWKNLCLTYSRAQVSAKSPTELARKYIAEYRDDLNLFLTDGRIEIDNNTVERRMRLIALNCPPT
jgi:hypothetical protein